jgi:hypothetical protein
MRTSYSLYSHLPSISACRLLQHEGTPCCDDMRQKNNMIFIIYSVLHIPVNSKVAILLVSCTGTGFTDCIWYNVLPTDPYLMTWSNTTPFSNTKVTVAKGWMPRPLYPWETAPFTYRTGGWVGPRAGLDAKEEKKNVLPQPGIEPRPPNP